MRRALLTFAICCSLYAPSLAQDQDRAPMLNAFGRFWGIGYSAGYHARSESRFGFHRYVADHNVVPEPMRGPYPHPHMTNRPAYGYPSAGVNHGYAPGMSGPTSAPPLPATQNASQNLVPAPTKPVDPPPNWLKQYIKPNSDSPTTSDDLLPESDNSPSDRRGVMLMPSPADSTTSLSITPSQITPSQPAVQIGGRPVISVLQQ